jgi:phosphoglycolate phosphatase
MTAVYKVLVFDWDGTLIDSEAKIIATVDAVTDELALPRLGAQKIRNIIGLGLPEAIEALFPGSTMTLQQQIVDRYRAHFLGSDSGSSQLFQGVVETLALLKSEGYLLAVATGKSRKGLARDLATTGLQDFFAVTRCADETASKPDPQMLQEIMYELDVLPQETVMIGDTEYDMAMARSAGTPAVAVSYGMHECIRLLQYQPLACLDSIGELISWLQRG